MVNKEMKSLLDAVVFVFEYQYHRIRKNIGLLHSYYMN